MFRKKIPALEILFGLYMFTVINLGWNTSFNAVFLHLKYRSNFTDPIFTDPINVHSVHLLRIYFKDLSGFTAELPKFFIEICT